MVWPAAYARSDTVARLGGDEFVDPPEDLSDNMMEAAARASAVGEKIITDFIQLSSCAVSASQYAKLGVTCSMKSTQRG